jgi:aquaporin Z
MATKAATTKKSPTKKSTAKKTTSKAVAVKKSTTVKSAPVAATKNTFVGHIDQSVRSIDLWRSLGAEVIGTFLLAAVVIAGQGQPIFVLFALTGIILLIGAVSGAHVNPAVTIGAWVTRRIGWLRAVGYIAAQVIGAALAYVVLSNFIAGAPAVSEEAQAFGQTAPSLFSAAEYAAFAGKEWFVFFAELLGAAVLGFAIANATRERQDRVAAAFTGGLGIFIALMVAVSAAGYVGASAALNPAIAVTLQAYDWSSFWPFAIYAIAPTIGAVVGFVIHDILTPRGSTIR